MNAVAENLAGAERTGRELIAATRVYAKENRLLSWWMTLSTLGTLVLASIGAATAPQWPVRLGLSLFAGLVVVRAFIVYHDFMHGAILRNSWLGRWLMYAYGIWVLNPPRVWRQTHNYHHAHTAKLVGSHIGSYAMLSLEMWEQATPKQRLMYKITRHPITIFFGYATIFLYGMCLSSFLRNPKRHWDSMLALVVHAALSAGLWYAFGFWVYFYALLLPLFVGCAAGAYLFYAQHNFPGVDIQPREKWTYTRASLESSSYMEMGPVMEWFTGNIGYHHVHHLNPSIPFYRLPEAMNDVPELQHPPVTSWWPRDVKACFALKLWDPERGEMVGYPD